MLDFESEEVRRHEVRLFPAVHISSVREAELRATAALLAIVKGVSPFGRKIVKEAGGPAGTIACYTEVAFPPFELDGPQPRPDGIIRSVRGNQDWKALVEVKVGDCPLEQEQFEVYHRLAREHGFDAIITVSSQAARADGLPPLSVDGRRARAVQAVHFSWDRLLSEARLLAQQNAVDDRDQEWMLAEWIRYVAGAESRIIEPAHLGQHWNEILTAARQGSLASIAAYAGELVQCWDDFIKKEALRLRAKLGVEVEQKIPLRERREPELRSRRLHTELLEQGQLKGEIRIPDAASDVSIGLNLMTRTVRFGVDLAAPEEGRQQTRVNWLVKQLRNERTPQDLAIQVEWDKKGLVSHGSAADVQQDVACLLRDGLRQPIPKEATPRRFALEWTRPLQKGRGRSTSPVLDGIAANLEEFYARVVEGLVSYVPPAPKLPSQPPAATPSRPPPGRSAPPPTAGATVPSTDMQQGQAGDASVTVEG